MSSRAFIAALAASLGALSVPAAGQTSAPLAEEPLGVVAELPASYPPNWVIVSDFNFNAIVDGRGVVVDTASENQPFKGMFRASQFASILTATTKPEIYTAETFFSRLSEGDRTDAITIWDKSTLKSKGEILLPGGKRLRWSRLPGQVCGKIKLKPMSSCREFGHQIMGGMPPMI